MKSIQIVLIGVFIILFGYALKSIYDDRKVKLNNDQEVTNTQPQSKTYEKCCCEFQDLTAIGGSKNTYRKFMYKYDCERVGGKILPNGEGDCY